MKKIIIPFVSIFFIIAGCANEASLNTPSQPLASPTNAGVNAQTETPTPVIEATLTPTPTLTNTSDPTSAVYATRESLILEDCQRGIYGVSYFRNNTWGVCGSVGHSLLVFNEEGLLWKYSAEELGVPLPERIPWYYVFLEHYTKDGNYIYVNLSPVGHDPGMPWMWDT